MDKEHDTELTRAAYNGYRLAHEDECPDKGHGPYASVPNLYHEQDLKAWHNSARWSIHQFMVSEEGKRIKAALESHKEFLSQLEIEGKLDVGMPIQGTEKTSYSESVQELLDVFKDYNG